MTKTELKAYVLVSQRKSEKLLRSLIKINRDLKGVAYDHIGMANSILDDPEIKEVSDTIENLMDQLLNRN